MDIQICLHVDPDRSSSASCVKNYTRAGPLHGCGRTMYWYFDALCRNFAPLGLRSLLQSVGFIAVEKLFFLSMDCDHALLSISNLLYQKEALVQAGRHIKNALFRRVSSPAQQNAKIPSPFKKMSDLSPKLQSPVHCHTRIIYTQEMRTNPNIEDLLVSTESFRLPRRKRVSDKGMTGSDEV